MTGQIQLLDIPDLPTAIKRIQDEAGELVAWLNTKNPSTISRHSRAVGLKTTVQRADLRELDSNHINPVASTLSRATIASGDEDSSEVFNQLVVHLDYDCADAMGANIVNTACEALAPRLELLTGGRVNLCIMTNLNDQRLARAKCVISPAPKDIKEYLNIAKLNESDEILATAHNKAVMDAIDGLVIATGNDWRAIEAGAHAYASRNGRYEPLAHWRIDEQGQLAGEIELPMALGIVGGATHVLPMAQEVLHHMRIRSARQLSEIAACIGLARSLDVIRPLSPA
jgi:degradative hydroxymethylglutaryl-CoA reductase